MKLKALARLRVHADVDDFRSQGEKLARELGLKKTEDSDGEALSWSAKASETLSPAQVPKVASRVKKWGKGNVIKKTPEKIVIEFDKEGVTVSVFCFNKKFGVSIYSDY